MENLKPNIGKRMLSVKEAAFYIGLGISNTRKFVEDIKAVRTIGNRVLIDKVVLDQYFDSLEQQQN